ncbi:MAG: ergothioneine biosynthesis protein EgtB [Actinomycetes bacterium]
MSALPTADDRARRRELADLLERARRRTLALVAPLDDETVHGQHVDFMSPLVWDVGHVGNFEELWLVRRLTGRPADDPARDELYNPFEQPRWVRGELPLPPREETLAYLTEVRAEVLEVLHGLELDPSDPLLADGFVHLMLAGHESQHQETMLQALGLRDDLDGYTPAGVGDDRRPAREVDDTERVLVPGGPTTIGTDARAWTYDNERPTHVVDVATFAIDRFPVTCRRWAAFVDDGGYRRPELWSARGRAWLEDEGHVAPQGWLPDARGGWLLRRFGRVAPLDPREPVQHVSFFEAEAFATWAGARLPTEHEWERAARFDPARPLEPRTFPWGDAQPSEERANVGLRHLGPQPVGSYPAGASALGVEQLAGDVYEWTTSSFEGYPGFEAFPYPEYSEVFFGGDYRVLRGSSWAIGVPFARATYRNWDHPYRRQLMAGVRLAHDVAGG